MTTGWAWQRQPRHVDDRTREGEGPDDHRLGL